MGFLGKMWAVIRGIFIRAGDDMVSGSPEAIRATYASAIDDAKRRYKDMERAVARLASEREKTESGLKTLDKEGQELQRKLDGALALAESQPDDPTHREAGSRYLLRMKEIDERQAGLAGDLDGQSNKVEDYKTKLRAFYSEIETLKREQGEMVAEFVSSQQVVQLEDRLRGLGETAVDESIVAIRDKVGQMKAEAKIAAEMRSSTVGAQDETYERIGAEKEAANRFDELLKARSAAKEGVPEKERDLG